MKKLSYFLILILLLSCEKNEPPTCVIVHPSDNDTFTRGENIPVSITADDSDGLVSEVRFIINSSGIASLVSWPYNYELNTSDFKLGIHTIKVIAIDNQGLQASDEVQIIVDADSLSVVTSVVTEITDSTAICGGNVAGDGGAEISAKGVCWSTSQNPTILNNITNDGSGLGKFTSSISGLMCENIYYVRAYAITSENPTISDIITIDGSGLGSFTSSITGLTCGNTYYVRAYAITSKEIFYGEQVSFTTDQCLGFPTITTSPISSITEITAQSGGIITDDGGLELSAKGVCWSTSQNPTILDSITIDGRDLGNFTSSISGLMCGNTYYVRAYATNSLGTAYGNEESFSTANCITVTDYDGNTYQAVRIGDQIWMTQNLKVTHYSDGSPIPFVEDDSNWNSLSLTDKAYSWSNNNISTGNTYGALYTWAAAMNGLESSETNPSNIQGACPSGWHLPSHNEWKQLEMYLGMSQVDADNSGWRGTDEGGKLKIKGTDYWRSPNTGANNSSGFTSIPSGYRIKEGTFLNIFVYAIYWSATEGPSTHAWYRHLMYDKAKSGSNYHDKRTGLSIRCVRD